MSFQTCMSCCLLHWRRYLKNVSAFLPMLWKLVVFILVLDPADFSFYGQKHLKHTSKYPLLCYIEERKPYGLEWNNGEILMTMFLFLGQLSI